MGKIKPGDERPEMGLDGWLLHAYAELSTCRNSGGMGGIAPIPWKAVADYADHHDLDDTFVEVILAADSDFTAHINEKKE